MLRFDQPWTVPIRAEEVPDTGRDVTLVADEKVRRAASAAAGVNAIARLEAQFHLTRQGRDRVRVAGAVSATVRQTCVVTLEPVVNEIAETVDVVFAPDRGVAPVEAEGEAPERMVDGIVDLGAIATEFLVLGVDPYPRKAGAVFEPPSAADRRSSPFAALSALKKGG